MPKQLSLIIYALIGTLFVAMSFGLWYMTNKADTLTAEKAVLTQQVEQEQVRNKQIISFIDETRNQLATLSADLNVIRDNTLAIDMTTKQQVLEMQSMKDRFKPFLAKPGLTERLVNKDFSGSVKETQCISGDNMKCVK